MHGGLADTLTAVLLCNAILESRMSGCWTRVFEYLWPRAYPVACVAGYSMIFMELAEW